MASQVIVVTGASGGVGRAVARLYGERRDKVALLARGEAGLAGAAQDVEVAGGQALPISVDTADAEAVDGAAERIENDLGPIDVWINDPAWRRPRRPREVRQPVDRSQLPAVDVAPSPRPDGRRARRRRVGRDR